MTHQVCMIGSGNMGSVMAKVIGENVAKLQDFNPIVKMYTYNEKLEDGSMIVDVINEKHENVKYLPGVPLPHNIVAIDNVAESCEGCDYIVIVTPHQFLPRLLNEMKGHFKENATAISLVKGVTLKGDKIELITDTVEELLGIECGALMGANIANDIAKSEFCESTIAFKSSDVAALWKPIFDQPNFRIKCINDLVLQQLCGTLKNVIATGVGFAKGLGQGESTKAALIRIGMEETLKFANWYFPERGCEEHTMLESCGVADFICTAFGGRNARCAEYFIQHPEKTLLECEAEILNGQKLQGIIAAREVAALLKARNAIHDYPLMCTIHMIATKQIPPETLLEYDGAHLDNLKVDE